MTAQACQSCGWEYECASERRRDHRRLLRRLAVSDLRHGAWLRSRVKFRKSKPLAALLWLRARLGLVRAAGFCPRCGTDLGYQVPR